MTELIVTKVNNFFPFSLLCYGHNYGYMDEYIISSEYFLVQSQQQKQ